MKKIIKIQNTNECNIHLMVKSESLASLPYKHNSVKIESNTKFQYTNECNIHLMVKSESLASLPYKLNSVKIESNTKFQLWETHALARPNKKTVYFIPVLDVYQQQTKNINIYFGKKKKPLTMRKGMYFVFSILPKANVKLIFDIVDKPIKQ